jgi:SAM-dependent methyltransferase
MNSQGFRVPENADLTGGSREDFLSVGCSTLRQLVSQTGITPQCRILEIGSGLGRVAYPIACYLEAGGRYLGLEIVGDSVAFCRANISHLAVPGAWVQFEHVDIYNEFYNPNSSVLLRDFQYPDIGQFDLIIMNSVCTHLADDEIRIYLQLVTRWLKPGGDFFATFFLIDRDAAEKIESKDPDVTLRFDLSTATPDYFLDGRRSTLAVAYRLGYIEELYKSLGLAIKSVQLGLWSGADRVFKGYQDVVVATLA